MSESNKVDLWALADLATPWCLYVAVTLHIAELLAEDDRPVDELARVAACDRDALHAVLGQLAGKGLFEEPEPGRFRLNEAGRQLLDPLVRQSFDLDGLGGRFAHIWATLLDYVRSGASAYQKVFGLPFFDDLQAHPQLASAFDELMGPAGHGTPDPQFPLTGGWETIRTVVDVGGGTGAMLAGVLRLHPQVRGILVDLPGTVARSTEIFRSAGVADRVTTAGQSFFDPLPAGADLYLLRGVLNDWPDREASLTLRRCAEALKRDGRAMVFKSVQPDDEPHNIRIEMLLVGGKPRSLSQFSDLARQSGLEVVASGRQPLGVFFVECKPL